MSQQDQPNPSDFPSMDSVLITLYPKTNSQGSAETTYDLRRYKGKEKHYSLYIIERGEEAPLHFHTGEDPSKDPEDITILHGRGELILYDGARNKLVTLYYNTTNSPLGGMRVLIPAGILHQIASLQTTLLLEQRITQLSQQKNDTYSLQEYPPYLQEIMQGKRPTPPHPYIPQEEIFDYEEYLQNLTSPTPQREIYPMSSVSDIFPYAQTKIR